MATSIPVPTAPPTLAEVYDTTAPEDWRPGNCLQPGRATVVYGPEYAHAWMCGRQKHAAAGWWGEHVLDGTVAPVGGTWIFEPKREPYSERLLVAVCIWSDDTQGPLAGGVMAQATGYAAVTETFPVGGGMIVVPVYCLFGGGLATDDGPQIVQVLVTVTAGYAAVDSITLQPLPFDGPLVSADP